MQKYTGLPFKFDSLAPKLGYLQRILDYAIGVKGDIIIHNGQIGKSEVEKFNRWVEIIANHSKYLPKDQNQGLTSSQFRRMR